MAAMKNSGATRRGAGKSQRGLHRFGPEIWEKFRGVRPARPVGMRPSGLGSGKSPSSTCHCARWQDAPAAEEVQGVVRRPGHTGIVRLPAGMSFEAGGLEHPDHLIVEMARVQGTVLRLTLANCSAISRVRRPNLKGLWRVPWRCHRSGSYFVRPYLHRQRASAESGPPGQAVLRISPKTRGRGRRRDGRPLTIFAF
jgi:hypothetical protein